MADNKVEIQVRANVEGAADITKLGQSVEHLAPAGQAAGAGARDAASGFAQLGQTALTLNQAKELITSLVQTLGGVPAEVLKTADAYNNLAARVQLVAGTGPAFEAAFNGIADVAKRTSSNLESTGLLFTKLAEAGKTMGIGQAEALKLTETVNQAIQLSGASAGASDAAIIQLVQGLQGGVLRGDEFNSVMEQSPRLAKALADGLGVTTGELRKMAEAGQLSSDTVIKALQGQSDAVATEFAKLPPTVGRALENLSTSWTLYIGETDKATGASKAAAEAISTLADNLAPVAGVMGDVGKAIAALLALRMAEYLYSIGQSALHASTLIAAQTAATAASTAATIAATVATEKDARATAELTAVIDLNNAATSAVIRTHIVSTAALLENAAAAKAAALSYGAANSAMSPYAPAMRDAQKSIEGTTKSTGALRIGMTESANSITDVTARMKPATAGMDTLGKAAGGVKDSMTLGAKATELLGKSASVVGTTIAGAFTAAGGAVKSLLSLMGGIPGIALMVLVNAKDIGTAIGEWAAKLAGVKDRTDELAAAEKAAATIAADNAAQRKRMADATQAAIDKQFELSKSAVTTIAEFDKLTKAGDTTAEAIKKIGKDFDLASIPGIKDASAVLDKLAADGKISATDFQNAWQDALKGTDLAVFETNARAAFAGAARESERLTQVLDATLREGIKRAGLDFAMISDGMSKASVSAINDTQAMINGLDRLKAMGVDTAKALSASLGKGIDTADSQKAIEAVRLQIESVRKVLGDKITDGLLDQAKTKATELGDALDKATPGITSLREAMKELGVTSDQTFADTAAKSAAAYQAMKDSGTASVRELQDGFKKYAADAIAAAGEVGSTQRAVTEEALKTEAAVRGLTVSFDENGKMAIDSQNKAANSFDNTRDSINSVTSALQRQNAELENSIAAQEKANELADREAALKAKKDNPNPIPTLSWVPNFQTEAEGKVWLESTKARMMQDNVSNGAVLGNAGVWIDQTLMAQFNAQMKVVKDKEKTDLINQQMAGGTDYATAKNRAENTQATGYTGSSSTQNHIYTVNIPNYGSVNVASANDASSLTNIIDQLARAKAAAGV